MNDEELKQLFKEADARGDRETAEAVLLKLSGEAESKDSFAEGTLKSAANIAEGMFDYTRGGLETALTFGTGMVAAPVAEAAGLGSMVNKSLGFDTGTAKDNREAVYNAMTYQPRYKEGQEVVEALSTPMQWLGEQSEKAGKQAEDVTGSELWGEGTRAMLEWGPASIVARALGSGKNIYTKEKVAKEMIKDSAGGRLEPVKQAIRDADPNYTGGQATVPARSYETTSLFDSASNRNPSRTGITDDFQQGSRQARLDKRADPVKRAFMERIRKKVADNYYSEGRKGVLPEANVNKVVMEIDKAIDANPGFPSFQTQLRDVKKGLVDSKGKIRTNAEQVLSSVDGLRSLLNNKEFGHIEGKLHSLKKSIVDISPKTKQGDKFYAETSRPITQMKVFEALSDSLKPRLKPDERASAYATAVTNQKNTIKKAQGRKSPYSTLDEVMSKDQMTVINKIGEELTNNAEYAKQASKGRQVMTEKVGDVTSIPKARILERTFVILNSLLMRIEGRYSKGGLDKISDLARPENRAKLIKFMDEISPQDKAILHEGLKLNKRQAVTSAIVGAQQQAGE